MNTDYHVGIEDLTLSYKEAQIRNLLHPSMKFNLQVILKFRSKRNNYQEKGDMQA